MSDGLMKLGVYRYAPMHALRLNKNRKKNIIKTTTTTTTTTKDAQKYISYHFHAVTSYSQDTPINWVQVKTRSGKNTFLLLEQHKQRPYILE